MILVIIGAKGMLGSELSSVFGDTDPVLLARKDLDITDRFAVRKKLDALNPDIIINAAAYTDVEGAEDNQEAAMAANGRAPGYLAEVAKENDALLVHYSTDYIFGGTKKSGYMENDVPSKKPASVYGASKLLGEQEIKRVGCEHYIIRTSWLFGKNGKDFIDTITRLATERDELRVVADQHGKPTYAKDLAQITRALVSTRPVAGVYHFVNEEPTTWHEYAQEIVRLYGAKQDWGKKEYPAIHAVKTEEFPTKAKRPEYSILKNTKFVRLRPWREALEEYISEL